MGYIIVFIGYKSQLELNCRNFFKLNYTPISIFESTKLHAINCINEGNGEHLGG